MIRLIWILSLLTMSLVSAWNLRGFLKLDYEVPPYPDFTLQVEGEDLIDDEDEDLNSRRLKKKSDVNKQSKSPKGKAKESGGRSNKSSVTKGGKSKKKSSTKKGSSSPSSAAPSGAPSEAPSAAPSDVPLVFPTATLSVG